MKKTFLLVVLMYLIGLNANAQSSQIATLSHENDVKVFYGANALIEAHGAAVAGDVITLSSGKFESCVITKSITVQGAGIISDIQNGFEETEIIGSVYIRKNNELIKTITIKGINFIGSLLIETDIDNIVLEKLRLKYVSFGNIIKSPVIINCIVEYFTADNNAVKTTYSILNSIVQNPNLNNNTALFKNCVINDTAISYNRFNYCTFENCCVLTDVGTSDDYINYTCDVKNCVSNKDIFKNLSNSTNKVCNLENLFKLYNKVQNINNFSRIDELFELTDEAKQEYLGLDGNEVGIYGGDFPFDVTSDFPRIIKCDVAKKSTVDGKLSVDIQVKTGK